MHPTQMSAFLFTSSFGFWAMVGGFLFVDIINDLFLSKIKIGLPLL